MMGWFRERLHQHISAAMYDTHGGNSGGLSNRILGAISRGYAWEVRRRNRGYDSDRLPVTRLSRPVVSVGNITVGGTGKTPMVIALAEQLVAAGVRPAIVSRGYGGDWEIDGGVVSDGSGQVAADNRGGDEPTMMAHRLPTVPVIVGRDRIAGGRLAIDRFGVDIILLDDGFQHRRLHRDLDLLLLDARRPIGNGRLIPRGPLREPVTAIARAGVIVMTHADQSATHPDSKWGAHARQSAPLFSSVHTPVLVGVNPAGSTELQHGPPVHGDPNRPMDGATGYAVTGIADNGAVQDTVAHLGCRLTGHRTFPDHHRYSPAEIESVTESARQSGGDILVTTEKDWSRLAPMPPRAMDLWVVGVRIDFLDDGNPFNPWWLSRVNALINAYRNQKDAP